MSQANCEAYCNPHCADRRPIGYKPIQQSFAVALYGAYARGEATCDSFDERLSLPLSIVDRLRKEPESLTNACESQMMMQCGLPPDEAGRMCYFEVRILYGADVSPCVFNTSSCEEAAACRHDAAIVAGWVEADRPWLGASP